MKNNKKHKNYKKTINLPKINFPMKANLILKEPKIIKKWEKEKFIENIKKNKIDKNSFIIHDGPPYANGNIHFGHIYNKIMKDIILKYKNIMNKKTICKPGWDCHGLPIEIEIQKKIKTIKYDKKNIYIYKFKKNCFNYAQKQIKKQKKNFKRLGLLINLEKHYKTMDFKNIANTIRTLKKFIELNYLERKTKPINWCIKCKSSLAEAEIIYKKKISLSSYITFKLHNKRFFLKKINIKNLKKNIELIIWTTTTWSIPGNCALTVNPKIKYSIIETKKKIYILSKKKYKNIFNKIKIKYKKIKSILGKNLTNLFTYHPISKIKTPILKNKYIKENSGTGIVHIAPQHGEEDYKIAKKYNLIGKNVINKKGKYIYYKFIKNIKNKKLKKAEKYILNFLIKNRKIILKEKIKHNYPFCWRHKKPIILRSTPQWFINIDKNKLRNKMLKSIKKVEWFPKKGYKKMKKMIIERPNWCISRQRIWGTPITLIINKKTKKLHPEMNYLMEKIANKIEKIGPNYWTNLKLSKFLKNKHKKYEKVLDVLDIWFDSGSTCFSVMNKEFTKQNKYIDLYLEGSDQYRGWFMSSLIIHTAINNCAPYKQVLSHGFVVDNHGKKMSKSLKNFINPNTIINKFGVDIIRLWVASSNYAKNIHISNEIISRTIESYRKIRNTIKFLISNLDEFNPKYNSITQDKMILIDKWIIHEAKKYQKKIIYLYNNFEIHKVTKTIMNFCINKLSNTYLDIIKDRKYTIKKYSLPYYSAQTTIWMLTETITKWIAPILSFTTEEIWKYIPRKKNKYIYTETLFNKLFYIKQYEKINIQTWKTLFLIKKNINTKIEEQRTKKLLNSSLESKIILKTNKTLFNKIKYIKKELKFFFLVSELKLKKNKKNYLYKIYILKMKGTKCKRCWHITKKNNFNKNNNICNRCIKNTLGDGEKRIFA